MAVCHVKNFSGKRVVSPSLRATNGHPYIFRLADLNAPSESLALAGVQLLVAAFLIDGVGPAVPGFHADEALGVLLPEDTLAEGSLIKGDRDLMAIAGIGQHHGALHAGQQADGIRGIILLVRVIWAGAAG